MTLGELITALEQLPADKVVAYGFRKPHSYRGYYDQLAFVPTDGVTIASMLADARSALGNTYDGWKGGEFTMSEWTDVWLAEIGCCGEPMTSANVREWKRGGER